MNTHCKNGNPTAYGFACGFIQKESEGFNKKELYKEHTTYHVRMFRGSNRLIWFSYEKLTDARKDFKNINYDTK